MQHLQLCWSSGYVHIAASICIGMSSLYSEKKNSLASLLTVPSALQCWELQEFLDLNVVLDIACHPASVE